MAGLPSPGPADERSRKPDRAVDGEAAEGHEPAPEPAPDDDGQPPAPALWAAALALLALLAFGVLIGSLIGTGSRRPERVVLAAAPSQTSAQAAAATNAAGEGDGAHGKGAEAAEGEEAGEEGAEEEEEEEAAASEGGPAGEEQATEGGSSGEEEAGESGEEEAEAEPSAEAPIGSDPFFEEEAREGEEARSHRKSAKASAPEAGRRHASSEALPPIKHVFLIVLGEAGFEESFGASAKAPYLAKQLRRQGELVENYYAVTSGELANEIALISGQGPTAQTAVDCPTYQALAPGRLGSEGQALGSGCVYPKQALSIGNQLTAAGKTWKAYVQRLGTGGCSVPSLGAADPHATPTAAAPYVTWRDPFAYLRSVTGSPSCAKHIVSLHTLRADLKSAARTPSLSYIAPDPCDDGSPEPCSPGQAAGIAAAEPFLRKIVPTIEASPAYREGGLIAITFDQALQSGPHADSRGCCVRAAYPNLAGALSTTTTSTSLSTTATATSSAAPAALGAGAGTAAAAQTTGAGARSAVTATGSIGAGAGTAAGSSSSTASTGSGTSTTTTSTTTGAGAATTASPGGGRVGLLLISKYVKPGSVEKLGTYDHFSLLLSIEALFKLHHFLGYAGAPGLRALGRGVYNGKP